MTAARVFTKFKIYGQRKNRAEAKQATQANEILNYGSIKFKTTRCKRALAK